MSLFDISDRAQQLQTDLLEFMDSHVYPAEAVYEEQMRESGDPHFQPPVLEELKAEARRRGLWNLFHPHPGTGAGLTNLEYAPLAEIMGRSHIASEACNCNAPDTGNMEVLELFGTAEHKEKYLKPLLEGTMASAFAMTEPAVASSDATNVELSMVRDGDEYVLNGRKWFASNALHRNCRVLIVMGKTDPSAAPHRQQSMMVVPIDAPGVTVMRGLPVFGYQDREGHAEIDFADVRVPAKDVLKGEGEGFAISQARLGPGRIHHCMRAIGMAERALELMCRRASSRVTFGKPVSENANIQDWIAEARIEIEMIRLLTLKAAYLMDTVGNKEARTEIAAIKVAAPNIALKIVDRAIQVHGGAGVTDDFPLAMIYAHLRTLRLADGPDEVHKRAIARQELRPLPRHRRQRLHQRTQGCGELTMAGLDLTGRTAIVTGASRGHRSGDRQGHRGRRRQRGAHLPVRRRRPTPPRPRSGAPRSAFAAHAVDEEAARRCVDLTLERFGSLDILVNNAGTNPAFGPIIDQDHARFAKTFDVNLWAPVLWTGLATKAWMGEHGGAVVNTASLGGHGLRGEHRPVQRVQGRADPSHQATGTGTLAEGAGQRRRAGCGADASWPRRCGRNTSRPCPASRPLGRIGEPDDIASRGRVPRLRRRELDHRRDAW